MKQTSLQTPTSKFLTLFGFQLVWGFILWRCVSAHGLGTSRDSVEYLFTSLSLARGDGFISFLGQPYVLWPPLYPILLALLQTMGIADPLRAALVLQLVTFVWIAALTSRLFQRVFQRSFALAFIGNAFAGTGAALTWLFQAVGSDYLFIALTLSMVYLCDAFIRNSRVSTIWLMALFSALAMLQRYIGITVLLTCAWIVFYYSRTTFGGKIKRLLPFGVSIIAIGIWILTLPVDALVRDNPSSFFENLYWFTFSILSWFFPDSELYGHPIRLRFGMWALWLGILACGLIVWKFRKARETASIETPLFLFGAIYTSTLLVIASLSSFNTLDSRFVSPIFIPFVVLILKTIETIFSFDHLIEKFPQALLHFVAYVPLLIALSMSGFLSVTSLNIHHRIGWGYTSLEWETNDVVDYWLTHKPVSEYLVFSNYPAGVAVHTWHVTLSSPRRTQHPNAGEAVIPLETYLPSLFEPGKESFIIWIEPNEYTHVYSVAALREVVGVEVIYESADGGIYRILPMR